MRFDVGYYIGQKFNKRYEIKDKLSSIFKGGLFTYLSISNAHKFSKPGFSNT